MGPYGGLCIVGVVGYIGKGIGDGGLGAAVCSPQEGENLRGCAGHIGAEGVFTGACGNFSAAHSTAS